MLSFSGLQQDPVAGASKRVGDADGGGRPKASKKDLTQNDIEQAIRNGRVIYTKSNILVWVWAFWYHIWLFPYWKTQMEAVTVQHLKDFLRNNNSNAPSSATKKVLFDLAQKLVN